MSLELSNGHLPTEVLFNWSQKTGVPEPHLFGSLLVLAVDYHIHVIYKWSNFFFFRLFTNQLMAKFNMKG